MGKQNSLRDIHKDAVIAKTAKIHKCVYIEGTVVIGERTIVKPFAFIPNGIVIGEDVFIGPNVTFTNDKYPKVGEDWVEHQTTVGDRASIGAGSTICPGVIIGSNAMVGAGSVVVDNVGPGTVVAGNPAKFLRMVDESPSSGPSPEIVSAIRESVGMKPLPGCKSINDRMNWTHATVDKKVIEMANNPPDPRGFLNEVLDQPVHINLIEIKAGYARGGHYHDYHEKFFVASGFVDVVKHIKGVGRVTTFARGGEVIQIYPNEPHYIKAYIDSVLIEIRRGGIQFKANEYKPFRDIVKKLMKQ